MHREIKPTRKHYQSHDLAETTAIGAAIANDLCFPACVYIQGGLGAGKTTLCKSIIKNFGYNGTVTSPTYNLIHEYPVSRGVIYHMDLYRLADSAELEFLALADLWREDSLFLIEWPDRGSGYLPKQTHGIDISNDNKNQSRREITFR